MHGAIAQPARQRPGSSAALLHVRRPAARMPPRSLVPAPRARSPPLPLFHRLLSLAGLCSCPWICRIPAVLTCPRTPPPTHTHTPAGLLLRRPPGPVEHWAGGGAAAGSRHHRRRPALPVAALPLARRGAAGQPKGAGPVGAPASGHMACHGAPLRLAATLLLTRIGEGNVSFFL